MDTLNLVTILISIFALVISGLSWWETRKSTKAARGSAEAAKASNHYSRLYGLFNLRTQYTDMIDDIEKKLALLQNRDSGSRMRETLGEYKGKLSEVNKAIELYHNDVVSSK